MREFELTFLLKPDLDDEKVEEIASRVRDIIAKNGTPSETRVWGKRPLAYPIQRYEEAIYIHIPFTSGADVPGEITHYFGLNENVLRHLIVHAIPEPPVIEPRIVTKKTEVFIPAKQVKEASDATPAEGEAAPATAEPAVATAQAAAPEGGAETSSEVQKAPEALTEAAPASKATAARKPRASRAKAAKGVEEVTGEVEEEEPSSPEDTPEG